MPTPKRYGVFRLSDDTRFTFRNRETLQLTEAFVQPTDDYRWPGDFTEGMSVVYTNSLEAAESLAAQLSERFPRNSYVTFTVNTVYYVPDTPPVKAVFSDRGLLPA